jgi:hypothetical protein
MCSLWRENYSKDTPSLSYKIAYFHFLTTLLPSIFLPFLASNHKKDGVFALLSPKSCIFVEENEADPTERFHILTVPIYMKRGTPYIVSVFIKSSIIN